MPRKLNAPMSSPTGAILQLKIRLLDISPMIWRRVLVQRPIQKIRSH